MIAGAFFFSLMALIVKLLNSFGTYELVFWRSVFMFAGANVVVVVCFNVFIYLFSICVCVFVWFSQPGNLGLFERPIAFPQVQCQFWQQRESTHWAQAEVGSYCG